MFINVTENNTSIFTVLVYLFLDSYVVATEKPASANVRTWDIVLATAAPSFAPTLYEVQNCFKSWWIQTANRRELIWAFIKCLSKWSSSWKTWVIFTSLSPNLGYLMCLSNLEVQGTWSWWEVFSFGCMIEVEKPTELIYFCVDFGPIQNTDKALQLRACIDR